MEWSQTVEMGLPGSRPLPGTKEMGEVVQAGQLPVKRCQLCKIDIIGRAGLYLVQRNWWEVVQGGQLPVKCRQLCRIDIIGRADLFLVRMKLERRGPRWPAPC